MVLTYLGTLDPVYSSAKPQIMRSSTVNSRRHHFLKIVVPEVIADTIIATSNRSALAPRGRQIAEVVLTWRAEVATLMDTLVVAVVPEGDKEVFEEDEEMGILSIATTVRSQTIQKYQCPILKEKPARGAHISATIPDEK